MLNYKKRRKNKMKKYLVFTTIIGLLVVSYIFSFAQQKQLPQVKAQQKIIINEPSIRKIISAENDKSQPSNSRIQRYRVVYETTKGETNTMIIQTEENEKGEILKAQIISVPKFASPSIEMKCPPEKPFQHCIVILDMRTGWKKYICWCSAYR
jgi:hypothetical protein